MRRIVAGLAVVGMQAIATADHETSRREWPEAAVVLKAVDPRAMPEKPAVVHAANGAVVLHGDLFKDGRHVALVGTGHTTLAVGGESGWEEGTRHEVAPAWVPPGKTPQDAGYSHSAPPDVPFSLDDLDGDGAPELLVAFDNDGYQVGYAIAKMDAGKLRFLTVRSERGRPGRASGCMTLTTVTSGRKAWWDGTTYYRWRDGEPEAVATWIEDSRDPEIFRWIAVRHDPASGDVAFEIQPQTADWRVRTCRWEDGVTKTGEKDLARVSFVSNDAGGGGDFGAETVLMFELTTGLMGDLNLLPKANRKSVDLKAAAAGMKIAGGEEAKRLLKGPPERK